MNIYARQGDLVFEVFDVSRFDLKPTETPTLAGNDSDPHTIAGTVLHGQQGRVHYIKLDKPVEVRHSTRHPAITLEPGSYRVRPLRERGSAEDRAVED